MEITNFLTPDALMTYAITLVMVELWVAFTKELPFIKKIPTKFYTFLLALLHLIIINTELTIFPLTTIGIYALPCNALILSTILCGGFDITTGKITINKKEK